MEFIFLFIGVFIGVIITRIYVSRREVWGHIDVDPNTGLCRVQLPNGNLANTKIKHAVLIVHHDTRVDLPDDDSRDELPL